MVGAVPGESKVKSSQVREPALGPWPRNIPLDASSRILTRPTPREVRAMRARAVLAASAPLCKRTIVHRALTCDTTAHRLPARTWASSTPPDSCVHRSVLRRGRRAVMDLTLIVYLVAWYMGNYWYNIYNKQAGMASGGADFAFTNAFVQLGVGSLYGLALWVLPDARAPPKVTMGQVIKIAPLGFYAMAAHAGAVYAMTAGAVSFGQIVKAGEPIFAAAVGFAVYGKKESFAKLVCLIPVIGGIAVASAKELDFTIASLLAASFANLASAFRGQENKSIMKDLGAACVSGAVAAERTASGRKLAPCLYDLGSRRDHALDTHASRDRSATCTPLPPCGLPSSSSRSSSSLASTRGWTSTSRSGTLTASRAPLATSSSIWSRQASASTCTMRSRPLRSSRSRACPTRSPTRPSVRLSSSALSSPLARTWAS